MTYKDLSTHPEARQHARVPQFAEFLSPYVGATQRAHLAKILLRIHEDDSLVHKICEKFFKAPLPKPNKTTTTERGLLLWLGPEELLLRSHQPHSDPSEIVSALEQALQKHPVAVVDVSDAYGVIRLSGLRARKVLQKVCPINLREDRFVIEDCARTLMAKASVLLNCPQADAFDVQVQLSFAAYAAELLQEAARSEAPTLA